MEFYHFLHVAGFALIVGVDLPSFYAVRRASHPRAPAGAMLLAAQLTRWTTTISGVALLLMLPLGVEIGVDLGAWQLTSPRWLTITWAVSLAWLALVIVAGVRGTRGRAVYTAEIWVRVIMGLGNIYDGAIAFDGQHAITTNWLAVKVLLFGIALLASGWVRAKMRPVREALMTIDPLSAQHASLDVRTAREVAEQLGRIRPGVHAILLMALIAAWMGINKPF